MNRRQFALSWGRKLFFGLAWPLFSLIGLIYLQSFVLPQSSTETIYFIVSYVGYYGLICSVVYFLLYSPLILIFPTYYFSRVWSLFLILMTASFLFFDAYVFSQFRLHLNMFFINLIYQKGFSALVTNKAVLIVFMIAMFIGSVVIWLRGNMTWRQMQKRFSNPVSNWYLLIIALAFGVSHLIRIYSSNPVARMQALFPVNIALTGQLQQPPLKDIGRLYYPKDELKCNGKGHSNIVFFVIRGWKSDSLAGANNPTLTHMIEHGSYYKNHFSGSADSEGGLFSLFYSLPGTYMDAFKNEKKPSVFVEELHKRKYQVVSFIQGQKEARSELLSGFDPQDVHNGSLFEAWKVWSQGGTATPPLFAFFYFDLNQGSATYAEELAKIDKEIRNITLSMFNEHVLRDTTIIITGDHGQESDVDGLTEEKIKTPLLIVWPHRSQKEFQHFSSHYDVVPTLMRELWNCKSSFSSHSIGKALNDNPDHPWHLIESENNIALMDLQKQNFTRITSQGGFEVKDFAANILPASKGRTELTLKALKDNYRFYKR